MIEVEQRGSDRKRDKSIGREAIEVTEVSDQQRNMRARVCAHSKDEHEGLRSNFSMQDPITDVVEEITG